MSGGISVNGLMTKEDFVKNMDFDTDDPDLTHFDSCSCEKFDFDFDFDFESSSSSSSAARVVFCRQPS